MQSRRNRHAFTLIELLVVIAIIAILAAILFPVFAQARAQARKINGVSMIKQVGLGMLMYIQDFDETFPRIGQRQLANQSWPNAIAPYHKSQQIVADPADNATYPGGGTKWPSDFSNGYYSIVANDAISHTPCVHPDGRHDYSIDTGFCPSWVDQTPHPLAYINAPSDYVMLVEGYAPWSGSTTPPYGSCSDPRMPAWACADLTNPDWTGNTDPNSKWKCDVAMDPFHVIAMNGRAYNGWNAFQGLPMHGEGTPIVFSDGHAKWIKSINKASGQNQVHGTLPFRKNMVPDQANVDLPNTLGLGDGSNGAWQADNWQ